MRPDNKLAGKIANLETCIARISEVYQGDRETFLVDLLRQESVLLNLQRACENVIDIANIAVAELDLGVPASAARVSSCWKMPGSSKQKRLPKWQRWSVFATWSCINIFGSTLKKYAISSRQICKIYNTLQMPLCFDYRISKVYFQTAPKPPRPLQGNALSLKPFADAAGVRVDCDAGGVHRVRRWGKARY